MKRANRKKIYLHCKQIPTFLMVPLMASGLVLKAAHGATLDSAQVVDLYRQAKGIFSNKINLKGGVL